MATTLNPQVTKAYAILLQVTFDDGTGTLIPKYIQDESERIHELQTLLVVKADYIEAVNLYIIENYS